MSKKKKDCNESKQRLQSTRIQSFERFWEAQAFQSKHSWPVLFARKAGACFFNFRAFVKAPGIPPRR
jgi:hypothetical protein